ncbi:MAG: imidazole glycerol phosphate synthase subunit HisH [Acidobacteria bacterium]|nr:imidazole glycerol phosphate synthase subunit HisH [Acidobacteriota bacterium]
MSVTLVATPFSNLGNIQRALQSAGAEVIVSAEPEKIGQSRSVVLPGVGNFASAARWLRESGVASALHAARERDAHILGICVGHQLLFDSSEEGGGERGLGFIGGTVRRFGAGLSVPQIGWNRVETRRDALFEGIETGASFYFVHSYHAVDLDPGSEIATADYGGRYAVAARRGTVAGVQFHPERSSTAGLRVLGNFVRHSAASWEGEPPGEPFIGSGSAGASPSRTTNN